MVNLKLSAVERFSVIILAAGASSRLGTPKQLLKFEQTTLLERSINASLQSGAERVLVVLGSQMEKIRNNISNDQVLVVENPDWHKGMSTTIKKGLLTLQKVAPDTQACIFMVCDQPFADAVILKKLLQQQQITNTVIAGSMYAGTKGIPALFHCTLFDELLQLKGDAGAKHLFEKYREQSTFIPFEQGRIDIDTVQDYQNLSK